MYNKIWFSEQCHLLIKRKKSPRRKYIQTKSEEDLIAFKKCRAEARKVLRSSKRDWFQKYISKINNKTPNEQDLEN